MKNLLHSLGRRQRADKKEECLPRGSAGEKQNRFFPFLCNVKMVGEEIIRLARREGGRGEKKNSKGNAENKLERREDQCIYTIHLWQSSSGLINLMFLSTFCPEGNTQFVILLFSDASSLLIFSITKRADNPGSQTTAEDNQITVFIKPVPDSPPPLGSIKWNNQF